MQNKKQRSEIRALNILKASVVFGSFIVYFIADGVSLSFGIFTREFIEYFNQHDSESFVFITNGLLQAVPLFMSPIVCFLIEKLSCRKVAFMGSIFLVLSFILARYLVTSLLSLNLVIGVMTSLGLAMVYIPAYLIISFHFDKRRALATGIAVSGSGLGLFVLSPLTEFLISEYGRMDACFLYGAIASHTFISACLFRSPEKPLQTDENNSNKSSTKLDLEEVKLLFKEIKSIYKTRKFLLVNLSYFVLSAVIVAPYNFLPSHVKLKQLDDPSSLSISLIGISTLAGQIILGYVSDMYRSFNWLIYAICIFIAGICTLILPLFSEIEIIYCYSIIYGFTTSVNYVLQSSLVIESLGLANLTLAFGCLQLSQGFTILLGTPLLGWAKDITHDYNYTFYISGFIMIISALILVLWPVFNDKKKGESISNDINENN